LTSVTLPDSVEWIDERAFADCELTDVFIPASVEWIEGDAFSGNRVFFTVHPDNPDYRSVDGEIRHK